MRQPKAELHASQEISLTGRYNVAGLCVAEALGIVWVAVVYISV